MQRDAATEVFRPLQADDPPVVAGYRLAARLGAGGMGRVYLSHTPGGRPVALKVVRPELTDSPAFRHRFRREIKAARRVRGAYTAELIDADADGVPPWLATLYVPGPSLSEAVARRGPLPVPAVLWLMAGVAEALQAIHGAGIVHRDLKPSNVLLAADGPRVIDFGISLGSDTTRQTETGTALGTPSYMAPEQASAGEVTTATDVFALGQTAAFAALGEPLYGDGHSVGVLYRIVHSEPDLSRLPPALRPLIARCLAAAPEERATPAEIVDWCRQRLGADADEAAGPAVWRDVTGPEPAVPGPVPDPTPVHTFPLTPRPGPGERPTARERPRSRKRRTALVTAAAVAAGALLVGGLSWTVVEAADRFRDLARSGATTSPGPTASSSAPAAAVAQDGARTRGRASRPAPTETGPPRAVPYPFQMLTEESSMSLKEPIERKDRKGDVRLVCSEKELCALQSRASRMQLRQGKPGAGLDECRATLAVQPTRDLSLSWSAAGSEICIEHPSGDIALFVIQVKSTALPGSGINFVTGDLTIWRAP
ncbi:serine/threonine-protein kinase [Streptomyces sp. adm13(2018)]|uniref:serine/threonine-protein kinase n=1 Tax=Streptomyces sp. adm13(2018) TaxID=2479007 RepID=UPI0021C6AA91|nr:serine/threonine-protein kinase [Streptomyces sp. adm13(2018)]